MSTWPPAWLHDAFSLLVDAALVRSLAAWRFFEPDGYRLRFLRQLLIHAGLLDSSTRDTTPLSGDWLAQPQTEQLRILTEAWMGSAESGARQSALARLSSLKPGQTISAAALTGRHSLRQQWALVKPLAWLGYLTPISPNPASPSDFARSLTPTHRPYSAQYRIVGSEIHVQGGWTWMDLYELEKIAVLTRIAPFRRYRLEAGNWLTANHHGVAAERALGTLERLTGEPLPTTIWEKFARPAPDVTFVHGVLVMFTHAAHLKKILKRPAWRRRLNTRFSGQTAFVTVAQAPLIRNALHRTRLTTHGALPDVNRPTPRSPRNTDRMHFLLAALVMQELAADLELPAPLDRATLDAMRAHLPLVQQRRLERAIKGQLERIRERLPEPRTVTGGQPAEGTASLIEEAVTSGTSLQIIYQPALPRPLITRAIVPLRLERQGIHTYLIAHCLQRHDTRTFRMDRIVAATHLSQPNHDHRLDGLDE